MYKYALFWPSYDGEAVQEAMKNLFPVDMSNRWLGQGDKVVEFEKMFAEQYGYHYCLSLNSGSAALELAYHLLGIGNGDEIITPVLTCTATNIPLIRRGAKIIFADVKNNLTIDYDDVLSKITNKTKAIVCVSLGGMECDERLMNIGLPIIHDAAQSVGVSTRIGHYVCYSFQAIKHWTTGDGGMLVTRNDNDYRRAKKLRWFGIDREAKIAADWQPYKKREMTMNIEEAGYKMHMNDIAASIGISGIRREDEWLHHRMMIARVYDAELSANIGRIRGGSYWLYGITVSNRDEVAEYLKSAGIETNMAHLRNDIFDAFGGKRLNLPNMNRLESQYLYIPINVKISPEDAIFIAAKVNEIAK